MTGKQTALAIAAALTVAAGAVGTWASQQPDTLQDRLDDALAGCAEGNGCVAEVQAVLDAVPAEDRGGATYLHLDSRTYVLDGTLHVRETVVLDGRGARIEVAPGVTALHLHPGAQYSAVRDLGLVCAGCSEPHDGVGVEVSAHGVRLDNVHAISFGYGVRAQSQDDDGNRINVNHQRWSNVVVNSPHHAGLYLSGGDANAGLISGAEVRGDSRYEQATCIRERSFLGNTWLAPATELCPTQYVVEGVANYSTFLGGYYEGNASVTLDVTGRTTTVGGNMVLAVDDGDRVGQNNSRLGFRGTIDGERLDIVIPHEARNSAIYLQHLGDGGPWELTRHVDASGQPWWAWSYQGLHGHAPLRWTGKGGQLPPGQYQTGTEAP